VDFSSVVFDVDEVKEGREEGKKEGKGAGCLHL
jgi:hypothetical protein